MDSYIEAIKESPGLIGKSYKGEYLIPAFAKHVIPV